MLTCLSVVWKGGSGAICWLASVEMLSGQGKCMCVRCVCVMEAKLDNPCVIGWTALLSCPRFCHTLIKDHMLARVNLH